MLQLSNVNWTPVRRLPSLAIEAALISAHACIVLWSASAIANNLIVAPKNLPASSPWDLAKLSEPPCFNWIDAKAPVRSLYYEGEPLGGHPTRVFAYYASPETVGASATKGARFPAVVLLHGGGGTAFRDWVKLWANRGYAAIAMDTTGHEPVEGKNPFDVNTRRALPDGGPHQDNEGQFRSIAKAPTEQWSYHAVAAAIRAHSLIRSFPDVDPDRTAVTGISWGGYLTLIVAGLDNRFKVAVPVYGCGHLGENSAWLKQLARMTPDERERWLKLWDPARYVPAITMPILFMNGTNDKAYPLDSYMKTYRDVPGSKQIRVTINMPHSHPDGWAPAEIGMFIDQYLRGGRPLPEITNVTERDRQITAKCKSAGRCEAMLNFTTDHNAVNAHAWQSIPAKFRQGTITGELPAGDITAWFLTVTDNRNVTVSSEVFLH
jgi:cephalosporin-C deacetylase-like acetyl esterase